MLIYWLNPVSREFVGVGTANEDPLTPGRYAIPADATTVEPPTAEEGCARVFDGEAWSQVPDHRGETWYRGHGNPIVIETLAVPGDLTQEEPPAPSATKQQLAAYANAKQWAVATGGRIVSVGGDAMPFSTSPESMVLISGQALRLQQPGAPASVNWQVGATDFVVISAADFIAAATAIADFVQATFDALPAVFAGIEAGTVTTTAEIDAALTAI